MTERLSDLLTHLFSFDITLDLLREQRAGLVDELGADVLAREVQRLSGPVK